MSSLRALRPGVVLAALERAGFSVVRVRGSHYQLLNPISRRRVTVPLHGSDLSKATVASILRQAGLTWEELSNLM